LNNKKSCWEIEESKRPKVDHLLNDLEEIIQQSYREYEEAEQHLYSKTKSEAT